MITFEATANTPGPDGNEPPPIVERVALQLRDVSTGGRRYQYLEGRAVPYGVAADVGWFVETHAAGSFARSTKGAGKNLPLLIGHDNRSLDSVAGHAEQWKHEADGMWGVWKLNDGPAAQRAAALADNGDLTGLSVGFQPVRSTWELVEDWDPDNSDYKDRVVRLESRLLEVSVTPTPAFADAQISLVRSAAYRDARRAVIGSRPTPHLDHWRRWRDEITSATR